MTQPIWEEEPSTCCECGAPLWPGDDPAFAIGCGSFVCPACAEQRNERYDADDDRWVLDPQMDDDVD